MGNTGVSSSSSSFLDEFFIKHTRRSSDPVQSVLKESEKSSNSNFIYENNFLVWERNPNANGSKNSFVPLLFSKNKLISFSASESYIVLHFRTVKPNAASPVSEACVETHSRTSNSGRITGFFSSSRTEMIDSIKEAYNLLELPIQTMLSSLCATFDSEDLIYPVNSEPLVLHAPNCQVHVEVFVWSGAHCNAIDNASTLALSIDFISFLTKNSTSQILVNSLLNGCSWQPIVSIFSTNDSAPSAATVKRSHSAIASLPSNNSISSIRSNSVSSPPQKIHHLNNNNDNDIDFPEYISRSPCFRYSLLSAKGSSPIDMTSSLYSTNNIPAFIRPISLTLSESDQRPRTPVEKVLSLAERRYRRQHGIQNISTVVSSDSSFSDKVISFPEASPASMQSTLGNFSSMSITSEKSLSMKVSSPTKSKPQPMKLSISLGSNSEPTSPIHDVPLKKPGKFALMLPPESLFESNSSQLNDDVSEVKHEAPRPFGLSLSMPSSRSSHNSTPRTCNSFVVPPNINNPKPIKFANEDEYNEYMMQLFEEEDSFHSEYEKKQAKVKFFGKHCSKITEEIYLGGYTVARDRDKLRKHGITHILNCAGDVCANALEGDLDDSGKPLFTYKKMFLLDANSEDITCMFYEGLNVLVLDFFQKAFADNPNNKVFVHCHRGVSRSAAMVIVWLMFSQHLDYTTAFEMVKKRRGITNPNIGFVYQLIDWHKRLLGVWSQPTLYRMAPHCSRDHTFVSKIVDKVDISALDSRGVFILCSPNVANTSKGEISNQPPQVVYIWIGNLCPIKVSKEWVEFASARIESLQKHEHISNDVAIINEGQEPDLFWSILEPSTKTRAPNSTNLNYKDYDLLNTVPIAPPAIISSRISARKSGSSMTSPPEHAPQRLSRAPSLTGVLKDSSSSAVLSTQECDNDNYSPITRAHSHFVSNQFVPTLSAFPPTPSPMTQEEIFPTFNPAKLVKLTSNPHILDNCLKSSTDNENDICDDVEVECNPIVNNALTADFEDFSNPLLFEYPSMDNIELFDDNDLCESGCYVLVWKESSKRLLEVENESSDDDDDSPRECKSNSSAIDVKENLEYHIWVWTGKNYEMEASFENDTRLFSDTVASEFGEEVIYPGQEEVPIQAHYESSGNESNQFWKVFYLNP